MEKNDPGRDPSYAGVIASRRERDCALGQSRSRRKGRLSSEGTRSIGTSF